MYVGIYVYHVLPLLLVESNFNQAYSTQLALNCPTYSTVLVIDIVSVLCQSPLVIELEFCLYSTASIRLNICGQVREDNK